MYRRSRPLFACFLWEEITEKSCHSSLQPCHSPQTGSAQKIWWQSTNKTKHHIIQVYGQHRLFRRDAVHLFGWKVDSELLKKGSFQHHS
jgi:hypothetical protein